MIIAKNGTSNGQVFSTSITYDSHGRLVETIEKSNGRVFTQKGFVYDNEGRIDSYEKGVISSGIYTGVKIQNIYDPNSGQLFQVKDKDNGKILWEINAKGQIIRAKLGATQIVNNYDKNNFITNINHTSSKGTILQIGYKFDAIKNELNNRITSGDFNIEEYFNYDDNNRLVSWTNPQTGKLSSNVYDIEGRIKENDMLGSVKFENTQSIYSPSSVVLNDLGKQKLENNFTQKIIYNENNDPITIDGIKGDVRFEYGLTEMRQRVDFGGNFLQNDTKEISDGTSSSQKYSKFTRFYSEDGSFEVTINNQTGEEKHVLYIGSTPYESNIIFVKNYNENKGSYKFLHKDYLGSILAITDESGNKLEQRHFDAWGNITHLQVDGGVIMTDENKIGNLISDGRLLIDRGYTSHEHFTEVGIIHI